MSSVGTKKLHPKKSNSLQTTDMLSYLKPITTSELSFLIDHSWEVSITLRSLLMRELNMNSRLASPLNKPSISIHPSLIMNLDLLIMAWDSWDIHPMQWANLMGKSSRRKGSWGCVWIWKWVTCHLLWMESIWAWHSKIPSWRRDPFGLPFHCCILRGVLWCQD